LNQLVNDLGIDLASKLSDLLGGQVMLVSNTGYISSISRYLTPADAQKLKLHYAGLKIYIPSKVENKEMEIRNEKIIRRINRGASINMVASEFGLSRRHIQRIRNGVKNVAI
jgi:Mor transcription activator family